jgi:hypothetical protein
VIGAVFLLVVALVAISGPRETVALPGTDVPARPRVALPANPPTWEIPDGVPVSLSIRNDGDNDDRLLSGSTPVTQ